MSQPAELTEMGRPQGSDSPLHGYQGNRRATVRPASAALSIAISREAGARGGTIARRVGQDLGWQVYNRELLEFMARDPGAREGLEDGLTPAEVEWVKRRLAALALPSDSEVLQLAWMTLALAAHGEVVFLGRAAGCILPRQTTLNIRVVSPLPERIAYLGQWLRLTGTEAAEKVRSCDEQRAEFVQRHFGRSSGDVHLFDMVLNTGLLGQEACAELIGHAARARCQQLLGERA